jgi:dUTP pyrophosphatase
MIKFSKIREEATYPTKATSLSSCWDLCSAVDLSIVPNATVAVPTGLVVNMPGNFEMQVRSRSGMSLKGIVVANAPGTIDADYTPNPDSDPFNYEIKVILRNQSEKTYDISVGDRIAQAAFCEVSQCLVTKFEDWKHLQKPIYVEPHPNLSHNVLGFYDDNENFIKINYCEIKDQKREGGLGSTGKR